MSQWSGVGGFSRRKKWCLDSVVHLGVSRIAPSCKGTPVKILFILIALVATAGIASFSLVAAPLLFECGPRCECGCNEGHPCLCFCATPDRPEPQPKKEPKKVELPNLAMHSNWGELTQVGSDIKIEGHSHWSAIGKILKSGKISLSWELLSDGRRAPGFYEWDGKELKGVWNFGDSVTVEDDGSLTGPTLFDKIFKLVPPEPEIH